MTVRRAHPAPGPTRKKVTSQMVDRPVRRPRNPLAILARWLGTQPWLMGLAPLIIWCETRLRAVSNNRLTLLGLGRLRSVEFTVPGRKSGVPRTTAVLAVPLGDGYLLTGSNWGRPKHPDWAYNLGAVQTASVRYGARPQTMAVHRVTAAEYPRYWADATYYWPGYEMERRLAGGREFRMFLLTPVR